MLKQSFVKAAYNTRGNELCKYVRAEVMENIEDKSAENIMTEEEYNNIVQDVMRRVNNIIEPLIDIEVDNIIKVKV